MNDRFEQLSFLLLKSTVMLTVSYVVVWSVLRWLKIQAIRIQTFAWCGVLLQAVLLVGVSVSVPVLPAEDTPEVVDVSGVVESADQLSVNQVTLDDLTTELFYSVPSEVGALPREDRANGSSEDLIPNGAVSQSTVSKSTVNKSEVGQPEGPTIYVAMIGLWISGIVVCLAWMGVSYFRFVRSLPAPLPVPDEWLLEWESLRQTMRLKQAVRLHVTDEVGPAVCWAGSCYLLLLPEQTWHSLTAAQRRLVLSHELAHVQRRDLWKSLAYRLLTAIQWHNPFAWLAVRRLEECAEWSCDDQARALSQTDACQYVQTLLEVSVHSHSVPTLIPAAAGHSLVRRAQRLLSPTFKEDSKMKTMFVFTVVCFAACFGVVSFDLVAQESDKDLSTINSPSSTDSQEETTQQDVGQQVATDAGEAEVASDVTTSEDSEDARSVTVLEADSIVLKGDDRVRILRVENKNGGSTGDETTYAVVLEDGQQKLVRVNADALSEVQPDGLFLQKGFTIEGISGTEGLYGFEGTIGFGSNTINLNGTRAPQNDSGSVLSGVKAEDAGKPSGAEAVIDLAYIFKRLPEFNEKKALIQESIKTADARMKAEFKQLQALQERHALSTEPEAKEIAATITRLRAELDAARNTTRLELTKMESEMYLTIFTKVRAAVAEHAKENGIRIVRRANTQRDQLKGLSSDDPQSIIRAMNAQVVYFAEEGVDITDEVLERLKKDSKN